MSDSPARPGEVAPLAANVVDRLLVWASAIAAITWIGSRVFLGLDFTDEMQYYGEIASLTRSGKFFQVDLFVQQLGYLFVLPLFKLHALLFPDQSYLVLFGRMVLVGGYALTGLFFWRVTARLGEFSRTHRMLALASLGVLAPFQIFAPSYNSMAFLLVVIAVGMAVTQRMSPNPRHAIPMAAVLAALTFVYPTAGLAMIGLTAVDAARRVGVRSALVQLALVGIAGALVLAIIVALHGVDFFRDLSVAMRFSRAFGVGYIFGEPVQLCALLALLVVTGLFLIGLRRNTAIPGRATSVNSRVRLSVIIVLALGSAVGWLVGVVSQGGFVWSALAFALLMLLELSVVGADGTSSAPVLARIARAVLFGSGAAVLVLSVTWFPPAYFATSVYALLLIRLAKTRDRTDAEALRALALVGTTLGTAFALTSGTRLHSFGLGAAATLPFLILFAIGRLNPPSSQKPTSASGGLMGIALIILLLANNIVRPYREDHNWWAFQRVHNVPAFAGIAMSKTKTDAIRVINALVGSNSLATKRVLVAGPHPWIYFVTRATPHTPMFFMHFTGKPEVYSILAARIFQGNPPDAVFVTNTMPPPIARRILEWSSLGAAGHAIRVPAGLLADYQSQTLMDLSAQVLLLRSPSTDSGAARPQSPLKQVN